MENSLEKHIYDVLIGIKPCVKRNRLIEWYYSIKNSRENEKEKEICYTMLLKKIEEEFRI